ncbi:hypothetical protein HDR66_03150, partial [bacterium]|nr:hypothetical protein [bacterium]
MATKNDKNVKASQAKTAAKSTAKTADKKTAPAAKPVTAVEKPVIITYNGVRYQISQAENERMKAFMADLVSRATVVTEDKAPQVKPVAEPVVAKKESATYEKLTDAVVQRLVGYDVRWGYNFETNSYLDCSYRESMHDEYIDDELVSFKRAIAKIPEFSNCYELSAAVTMVVKDSGKRVNDLVSNPQHDLQGTVGLGNIIVRNKKTGRLELYSSSWMVCNGHYTFAEASFHTLYDFL